MVATTPKTYHDIKTYIAGTDKNFKNWFVGITANARECLFIEHGVSEQTDKWIYRRCYNNRCAKNIKESLMTMGCSGDAGGWDDETTTVYAYLKNEHTIP